MGRAKEIILKVIPAKIAVPFVKAHHYSGKIVNNSKVHFGAFLDGKLHGVMSYGSSMDKSKIIGLVAGTEWNEFLELNHMAFDEYLPRNSESYCIAKSIRLIKRNAPHIKWIISFADGCSCGDGTIYRAANFVLTGIKAIESLALLPDGTKIHKMTLATLGNMPRPELGDKTFFEVTGGSYSFKKYIEAAMTEQDKTAEKKRQPKEKFCICPQCGFKFKMEKKSCREKQNAPADTKVARD